MGPITPCVGAACRWYGALPPGSGLRRRLLTTSPSRMTTATANTDEGRPCPPPFSTSVDGAVDGKAVREAFTLVGAEERLWSECVGALRNQVPEATWQSCFSVARAQGLDGNCLVLSVPSAHVRQRIEERYLDQVRSTLAEVGGTRYDVRLEVSPDARPEEQDVGAEEQLELEPEPFVAPAPLVEAVRRTDDMPVNPRYTFAALVTGASTRSAHAAA